MAYKEDIQNITKIKIPWVNLSGCNILVVGATGLIGSCLVEVLMERSKKDYNVYAMGRNINRMKSLFERYMSDKRFHYFTGDVTETLPTSLPFHYIIHAASGASPSEFSQHPVEVMKANILGVANLMEYGINHSLRRFLYVSSGEVYGEGDGREFSEDYSGYVDSTKSRSCYPSSKRAAETLCASYAAEYGVDVVFARPCHTYGPNYTENDNRVYAQFLRNVLKEEDIVMKSTGSQYRSWCYVVNCVSALLYILLKGRSGEAYNIADDNSNITIKELAETIARIGKRRVVMEIPTTLELQGFNVVSKSVYRTDKIKELGWVGFGDLQSNLESTLAEKQKT